MRERASGALSVRTEAPRRRGILGCVKFDEVLRTFSTFFTERNIPFAVIGGLAMQAWGSSRFTKDVDLVVPRAVQPTVLEFAESLGYETLYSSDSHSNHHSTDPKLGRVDFMYVSGRTADALFTSAEERRIVGDVSLPVPRPEYLAMMKGLAMKAVPQRALYEGEDIRLLLSVPGVDRTVVREYFRQHDMLDLYDAIARTL